MEMSSKNDSQEFNWEAHNEDAQMQFPKAQQDEVISVFNVYLKESEDGKEDKQLSMIAMPNITEKQLMEDDELDTSSLELVESAVNSITKNDENSTTVNYKILAENDGKSDENGNIKIVDPQSSSSSSSSQQMIDKDDPRSRLHFVKYLKRDGKSLKIWECGICSKEFRHQYTLMRHLPTHTDERNFKCDACGKAFRQLSTLSQHKAIHSDARPYNCEFCNKTFNRVSTLISHRKTHSEHKPHKCPMCGKGFHQKGNLRNHEYTHTNERPYKCEMCGKGFNQMSNLVCHKIKTHAHAGTMQYTCGMCDKEFPRRSSLRSHEESKHGIKYRNPSITPSSGSEQTPPPKSKNVRIVQLPKKKSKAKRKQPADDLKDEIMIPPAVSAEGIVVEKIETKSMIETLLEGQVPFALYKPVKGMPILVKVTALDDKHVLTPATAENLRLAGRMTLSPTLTDEDAKAVQIKVPIVATVTQHLRADGTSDYQIEPPGPDNEQVHYETESLLTSFAASDNGPLSDSMHNSSDSHESNSDECSELLELAAQGGIQFVRATEDGRYEVMSSSEARDLMAQNSHDVTILDGEEADALNVIGTRDDAAADEQPPAIIDESAANQIMVLDLPVTASPLNKPPAANMPNIEILDEKDIKMMAAPHHQPLQPLDERSFMESLNIFNTLKPEDLLICPKSLNIEPGSNQFILPDASAFTADKQPPPFPGFPGDNRLQESMVIDLASRQDLSSFINQAECLSGMGILPTLLSAKNAPPIPFFNEGFPHFFKNDRSFAEELSMLNEIDSSINQEQPAKIKFGEFDEAEFAPGNQQGWSLFD